jgi:hypothetical protein
MRPTAYCALCLLAIGACGKQVSPLGPSESWILSDSHWSADDPSKSTRTAVEVFPTRADCDGRLRSYLDATEQIGQVTGRRVLQAANTIYIVDTSNLRVLRRDRLSCVPSATASQQRNAE